jgi:sec-independent protein translocase protein TatA
MAPGRREQARRSNRQREAGSGDANAKVLESACTRESRMFALFGPIGIPELVLIVVIIILIFGANRLPEIGRGIGKGIRNFRDASKDDRSDL